MTPRSTTDLSCPRTPGQEPAASAPGAPALSGRAGLSAFALQKLQEAMDVNRACRKLRTLAALQEATHATTRDPRGSWAKAAAASALPSPRPRRSASSSMLNSDSLATPRPRITTADRAASSKPNTSRSFLKLAAYFTLGWLRRSGRGTSVPPRAFPRPRATKQKIEGADVRRRPGDGGDEPGIVSASVAVRTELGRELQSPSAAAGLRREFSPARPPGLGGGHCALGLVDAVAHEPCGGSPVQGYKG